MITILGHQFSPIVTGIILLSLAILATFTTFVSKVYISEKLHKPALGTVVAVVMGIITAALWLLFILASGLKVVGWFIQTKVGRICMLIFLVATGLFTHMAKGLKSNTPKQVYYDKNGGMHYDQFSRSEANNRIDQQKKE